MKIRYIHSGARTQTKRFDEARWALRYIIVVLLLLFCLPVKVRAADGNIPSKMINVVYDDSGSMIRTDGQYVDTWCQAKYAMEVFAAMLGERDSMNIYYMSDFGQGTDAEPKLSLNGADGARANVEKIHDTVSEAGSTPFNAVRKAYSDLESSTSDDKWLVVLTDGAFEDGRLSQSEVDSFFAGKQSDVSVMFLGMGPDAGAITEDRSNHIFYEKAETNKDILGKVTEICTRIFNSNRLEVNASKTISFDVPMGELVVFAQGENVVIDGIKGSDGQVYKNSTLPVNVQYSEIGSINSNGRYDPAQYKISRDLKGQIATFKEDFSAGDYQLEVSGADTIEVYYKPNVEIAAYLTSSDGDEVTSLSSLRAGDYIITFGFVKAGTTEKVNQSKLLGEVSYSAIVYNNGVQLGREYTSGDTVYIQEGTLEIDAEAQYLQYNTVSTHLYFSIFEDKTLGFSILDCPTYLITKDGMDATSPIQIKALFDGREVTQDQWNEMSVPVILLDEQEGGVKYGEFVVEKSSIPGIYNIYPSLSGGLMSHEIYQDYSFTLFYDSKHGEAAWTGEMQGKVPVEDTRTWFERFAQMIIRWCIIAAIALFILGYIPPFKKYLPKKLKRMPAIVCTPRTAKVKGMVAKGKYEKRTITTLIPYKAEEGSIRFSPPGLAGIPIMRIRAAGGNMMYITNTKAYAGRSDITFNGAEIAEGETKPKLLGSGAMIEIETKDMTCMCVPNQNKS